MTLSHPDFEEPIRFSENQINAVVIENKSFYYNFVSDLIYQLNEKEGRFVLSDGIDKDYSDFSCVDIITDVFSMSLNTKKNLNKLLSLLTRVSMDEDNFVETQRILSEIECFADKIKESADLPLVSGTASAEDVLKICGIKFAEEAEGISERICDYINVMSDFSGTKLFVFLNAHLFLPEEELEELYSFIAYKKINVLFLEGTVPEYKSPLLKIKIIDNDLCEIY